MKKLIVILMICALAFGLCACTGTKVYHDTKYVLSNQFILIKKCSGGFCNDVTFYLYDKNTKIVYLYTNSVYHATMCPYYVMVDGTPAIAVYGLNYNVEEQ